MTAAYNPTTYDPILKDVYTPDAVERQTMIDNPFFAILKKERNKQAGGKRYVQPVRYSNSTNDSADFNEAMTNHNGNAYEDFLLTRKPQYGRVVVSNEIMLAARSMKEEAFQPVIQEFDDKLLTFGEKIAHRLARTSGGSLGRLSIASTNTTTLSFADSSSVFNLQIGSRIQFSATDGTGTLLDGGDYTTVTEVDHDSGNVTIADNLATKITGVATNSYVFIKGDYNSCLSGLEDWLPVDDRATKLAASFHGVIRSVAPTYLGGVYLDGTSYGGLDEVMIKLVGRIRKFGGKPNLILANPESLTDLDLLTNSRVKIVGETDVSGSTSSGKKIIGFSGYKVRVGDMLATVVGDRTIPSNRLYALTKETWRLWHAGSLFNWLNEVSGGPMMRAAENEDATEARIGMYGQLGCCAPAWNGVAKINPAA